MVAEILRLAQHLKDIFATSDDSVTDEVNKAVAFCLLTSDGAFDGVLNFVCINTKRSFAAIQGGP